jgi:hypothetical protein
MRAYRNASVAETDGVAPLSAKRQALPRRHPMMGSSLFPTFFVQCSAEAGLIGAVSLFEPRGIEDLVVAAIIELRSCMPYAPPFDERIRKKGPS